MASKPVQIRKKMFGPNQYNTYCPACFQKGVRSKVIEGFRTEFKRVKGQRALKKISTNHWSCQRDSGPNRPHDCGWRAKR